MIFWNDKFINERQGLVVTINKVLLTINTPPPVEILPTCSGEIFDFLRFLAFRSLNNHPRS